MRPPIPTVTLSRRAKIALWVVAILIVLVIALSIFSGIFVNWLWYGEVGYRQVYRGILWTRIWLFVIFGVLMALILGGNMVAAYLLRPPFRPMSAEQQNLERYRVMLEPRKKLILSVVSVIALLVAGLSASGRWSAWLLWMNGGSFGVDDPQFHKDISFYAFDYPVYRIMLGFGFTALIFAIILSVAVHYLTGAIRLQTPGPKITLAARRHLTILVFVFMVLKAIAYWLDRYGLVFSDRSKFTGASYTDVHSELPAKTILFWIAIVIAVGLIASLWWGGSTLPAIGFVSMLILSILIAGIYPAIVQQVSVKPNANDKEAVYITRNINATRQAYDIATASDSTVLGAQGSGDQKIGVSPTGRVNYYSYQSTASPDTAALRTKDATMENIRILDPYKISQTFTNLQRIRFQYGFSDPLDIDRYTINGTTHDYVVGVRSLQPANLKGSDGNWINAHTQYTHGYGFVAAEADTNVTLPPYQFTEGGIPPSGPLNLRTPQVYYGEGQENYVIAGAKGTPRERDGNGSTRISYGGKGGVSLSSPLTRLAFAVNYRETNFLLNDVASASGAKVLFNRDPRERVKKVAPFLTVDSDPYPVVDQKTGHVVWIVDAYTTMANYPYSQRQSLSSLTGTSVRNKQSNTQINYIRNSVKATVDAYDGTVNLYQWDNKDPILNAWKKTFPGLIKSGNDMPPDLKSHIRYPEDFFDVQRALVGQYHVNTANTWYNNSDKWTVPTDPFPEAGSTGNQPSYYVLANDPHDASSTPQFQLTSPMVVNGSTNLAAYLSVNSDPGPNYGKITVLTLPTGINIPGPTQIASDFKTDATISKEVNIFNQSQSSVIHGNLLTLPVGNSFLYVEPLYVQSSFPTLQRVIVWYGGQIGYGSTLARALSDFLPGHTTGETIDNPGSTTNNGNGTTSPPTTSPSSPSTSPPTTGGNGGQQTTPAVVLRQLDAAYAALQAAYRSGDAATIGAAQQKVNNLVKQYLALVPNGTTPSSGGSPSGSGSPRAPSSSGSSSGR